MTVFVSPLSCQTFVKWKPVEPLRVVGKAFNGEGGWERSGWLTNDRLSSILTAKVFARRDERRWLVLVLFMDSGDGWIKLVDLKGIIVDELDLIRSIFWQQHRANSSRNFKRNLSTEGNRTMRDARDNEMNLADRSWCCLLYTSPSPRD